MAMKDVEWNDQPAVGLHLPDLKGKIALVTGTSAGIGTAVAARLVENGATVYGVSRTRGNIEPAGLTHIECDLSDMEAINPGPCACFPANLPARLCGERRRHGSKVPDR